MSEEYDVQVMTRGYGLCELQNCSVKNKYYLHTLNKISSLSYHERAYSPSEALNEFAV